MVATAREHRTMHATYVLLRSVRKPAQDRRVLLHCWAFTCLTRTVKGWQRQAVCGRIRRETCRTTQQCKTAELVTMTNDVDTTCSLSSAHPHSRSHTAPALICSSSFTLGRHSPLTSSLPFLHMWHTPPSHSLSSLSVLHSSGADTHIQLTQAHYVG